MRVLLTGGSGFVGSFLIDYLQKEGVDLHLITRRPSRLTTKKKRLRKIKDHRADILDKSSLQRVIKRVLPDAIVHLAAFSLVAHSWDDPVPILQTNFMGSLYLLEAVRKVCPAARVLLIGSSDVYGKVSLKKQPIKETQSLKPVSPYGVSKAAVDFLAFQYGLSYNLDIMRTRSFNHTGPGQSLDYVVPSFAYQVAQAVPKKKKCTIQTGNLNIQRDFTDVRDVVRAYAYLLRLGKSREAYNICSGRKVSLKAILQKMSQFAKVEVSISQDPLRMRPADLTCLWGSPRKLKADTGWRTKITFNQMCRDVYDYWEEKTR